MCASTSIGENNPGTRTRSDRRRLDRALGGRTASTRRSIMKAPEKCQAAPVPTARPRHTASVRRLCARPSRGRPSIAGHVRQRTNRATKRAYVAWTVCRVRDARCDSFQGERPRPYRLSATGNSRTCTCSRYRDEIRMALRYRHILRRDRSRARYTAPCRGRSSLTEQGTFHRFRSCRGLNTRQYRRAGHQRVRRADHRLRAIALYKDRLDGAISADHFSIVRSVLIACVRKHARRVGRRLDRCLCRGTGHRSVRSNCPTQSTCC